MRRVGAIVVVLLVVVGTLPAGAVGTASAQGTTSYVLEQGDQCVPLTPLQGNEDVVSFYNYSAASGQYSSHMEETQLQKANTSRLFLYEAPDGTLSLVVIQNKLGANGDGNGFSVSFQFDGLRSSEQWVVQDDNYDGRDDDFERANQRIDWIWSDSRTDGVAIREITPQTNFTITPYFNEMAEKYDHYSRTGHIKQWQVLSGSMDSPTATTLHSMTQQVRIRAGTCGSNQRPSASLSASPSTASVGQSVTLDASASTDDGSITKYKWDFDGDSVTDATTSSATVTHSYGRAGTVHPTVTVVDDGGKEDTASTTVNVSDTTDPTARLTAPSDVTVGQQFTADGSNSTDNTGIASYRWSFGDGTTATGATATHSYGSAGTYTVTLTVTDGAGNTDTASQQVNASAKPNQPPSASLSASPNVQTAGDNVTFDASGSTDDSGITQYRWDFDGNGSVDRTTSSAVVQHAYAESGQYTATVTVVDGAGATDSASATVNVTNASDTTPPDAALSASPTKAGLNETVSFDASGSSDNWGIVEYRWDFEGDGSVDATTTSPTTTHAYSAAGSYDATVTVVDAAGNTDTANVTVSVADRTPPTVRASVPGTVAVNHSATFDASASTDNDRVDNVTWTFGDGTTATGATVQHAYDATGNYTVTVTVTDPAGNHNATTRTVRVVDHTLAANLSVDPGTADVGNVVQLLANVVPNATYRWDFTGDGSVDLKTDGETATYRYNRTGTYHPRVTVEADGQTASDSATVNVIDNAAPDANVSVPATVTVNQTFTADASASSDDGTIAGYRWTFGDGATATGQTATHAYAKTGIYYVTVNVTDAAGNSATDMARVEVNSGSTGSGGSSGSSGSSGGNGSSGSGTSGGSSGGTPTARISAPSSALVGQTVDVSAARSSDNGSIVSYRWDFDMRPQVTGENQSVIFPLPKTYTITLKVTDDQGNVDFARKQINVSEVSPDDGNLKAILDVPHNLVAGQRYTMDASQSTTNSHIIGYWWDTDGDGQPERHTTKPVITTIMDRGPGTYQVKVWAVEKGRVDAKEQTVHVTAPDPPGDTGGSGSSGSGSNGSSGSGSNGSSGGAHHSGSDNGASGGTNYDPGNATNRGNNGTGTQAGNQNQPRLPRGPDANPPTLQKNVPTVDSTSAEVEQRSSSRVLVDVHYPVFSRHISFAPPSGRANASVRFTNATIGLDTAKDFDVVTHVRETAPNRTGPLPVGFDAASYLTMDHPPLDASNFGGATFTVTVDRSGLEAMNATAGDVSAYHWTDGSWERVNATLRGQTNTTATYRVHADSLSTVAVGVDRPVFKVTDLTLNETSVPVGETAEISAVVANVGHANGTANVTFEMGDLVRNRSVSILANGTSHVTFIRRVQKPGTYLVSVDGVLARLEVTPASDQSQQAAQENSTTTTTSTTTSTSEGTTSQTTAADAGTSSTGQPGFGLGVALLALLAAALVAVRRRE